MLHLGIKTNISQPKCNREIKATNRTFEDLINRNWKIHLFFNKLFTDVSYIRTTKGWSYLSVVLDSFNNEVLSWELSKTNDNSFVLESIKKAMKKIKDYSNTIIHSDHGYQYFQKHLSTMRRKLGIK